ncbi:MAG TPA: ATP-binding protein [Acidobacteriaceae bacterium]|nr:ATP-binding protein [Acidobacteriaceae bacterium]
MAGLVRGFGWSNSPLGPIEEWSPTLISTVNMLMAAHHPMVLLWGLELIHFYNDGFRKSLGPDKHPMCLGLPTQHCWPEIWEGMKPKIDLVFASGEPMRFENQYLPFAGEEKLRDAWWTYSYSPVRDADGATRGILILCQETTAQVKADNELKRAYAALMQSEKLAAIGRMTSSIAHEINNPLESLTNLLYLLQTSDDREQREHFFKQAEGELQRIARVTRQTLRFHRQNALPQAVQLNAVVENVLALMQGRLRGSRVSITTEYRTERPVYGYEADLRQVFANFLSNALDALGSDGRIVLRVEESTDSANGAPAVRVVIADNGHGMDHSTSERIFQPFFTTRPLTGTGLGLWVSMGILHQHGAHIQVRSTQDSVHHGTVFRMIFPTAAPASLASSAQVH